MKLYKPLLFSLTLTLLVWVSWYLYTMPESMHLLQQNWQISVTMIFGSFIAGGTSEGGGAIAFPVFTKILHIAPMDAKIFSLAIQSVGMTAASLTILVLRVAIEKRIILWASLGGVPGIIIGSSFIAPYLPPTLIKMTFTAMVSSFAVTLAVLIWKDRQYNQTLAVYSRQESLIMLGAGFMGGIMSGLVGNGIDIICFSVMVLLFRISEKIATPTSVVLMAINSIVGFALHNYVLLDFTPVIQNYWLAAVPVVIIGAPLGAFLCSRLNRRTIAMSLIGLIVVELMTSLWLIKFNDQLILSSVLTGLLFTGLYLLMLKTTRYAMVDV